MCLRLILLTAIVVFGAIASSKIGEAQEFPSQLEIALEDALAERTSNLQKRLEVVVEIDNYFSAQGITPAPDPSFQKTKLAELWRKSRFVNAATHMRLSQVDLAGTEVADLIPYIDPKRERELWFRSRSLEAAILLVQGMKEKSLNSFETLIAGDLRGVSDIYIDRAKINYAAALNENGRLGTATEIYESIMLDAMERHNDQTALHAGNNLINLLESRGDLMTARHILSALKVILARSSNSFLTQSLRVHELGIMYEMGDHEAAKAGLNDFISQPDPPPPLLLGTAQKCLADISLEQGQLDLALAHATKSVEMLNNHANEMENALTVLARILIAKQDYARAFEVLDQIDLTKKGVPSNRKLISQFKLEAKLRMEGNDHEAELLRALMVADKINESTRSKCVSDYFDAKLVAVRRKLALQLSESEALILAKANQVSARNRNLWYGFIAVLGLCSCLLIYIPFRRKVESVRRAEQEALSEKLELLVEGKTRELKANLQVQEKMAKVIERKKRVETIGLLAGKIAHDMNNLLQVIANANQVIGNSSTDDVERTQLLQLSNRSLNHGTNIIRQLLSFSSQEELAPRVLSFSSFVNENGILFRSALGSRIEMSIHDESNGACINVEPSRMTTAILNLLSNAADAIASEGQVRLEARRTELNEETAGHWHHLKPKEYLELSICDSGCGMSEEQIARAFEPFFSTKGPGKGTGLGLSSVHDFVKQSGGDVKIQSKKEGGTRVQILLPLVQPSISNVSNATHIKEPGGREQQYDTRESKFKSAPTLVYDIASSAIDSPPSESISPTHNPTPMESDAQSLDASPMCEAGSSLRNKRILIVEDNEPLARSLMMLVNHLEMKYEWAASGDEAIKLLKADSNFNYVISDVNMPGATNGPTLVRWIHLEFPNIHAFLMSGYSDLDTEIDHLPLLHKPFTLNELKYHLLRPAELGRQL